MIPRLQIGAALQVNTPIVGDGAMFLSHVVAGAARVVFFDPQYRALNDRQGYGDVKSPTSKMAKVHALQGMPVNLIRNMLIEIDRVLTPWGHCFLWVDKFMLVEGVQTYLGLATSLKPVDMIVWHKQRIGMGYRSRRTNEYLVVLQKMKAGETRAKGCWKDRGIQDTWSESVIRGGHPHAKPIGLIKRLIECVSEPDDLIVDPAAGSYNVLKACRDTGRMFVGCDLVDPNVYEALD